MNFESMPTGNQEKKQENPNELLDALISYSDSIKESILDTKDMLSFANEKGNKIDEEKLNEVIKKFESQMVQLRGDINQIKSEMYNQGVRMTENDVIEKRKDRE